MRLPIGIHVAIDRPPRAWYGQVAGHVDADTYLVRIGGSTTQVPVRKERIVLHPDLDAFFEPKVKVIKSKGEQEGFVCQDLLGIEQVAQQVCKAYPPGQHVFLCLGNSPYPLCYYLEAYKECRVIYMPMSNVECLSVQTGNAYNTEIIRLTEEAAQQESVFGRANRLYETRLSKVADPSKLKTWQLEELREDAEQEIRQQDEERGLRIANELFEFRRRSFQEIFKVEKYRVNFTRYVSHFIDFKELTDKNLTLVVLDFVTSGNAILGVSEGLKAILRKRGENPDRCRVFGLRAAPELYSGLEAGVCINDGDRKRVFMNTFLRKVIKEKYKALKLLLCATGKVNFDDVLDRNQYALQPLKHSFILVKLLESLRKELFAAERGLLKFARQDVFGQ